MTSTTTLSPVTTSQQEWPEFAFKYCPSEVRARRRCCGEGAADEGVVHGHEHSGGSGARHGEEAADESAASGCDFVALCRNAGALYVLLCSAGLSPDKPDILFGKNGSARYCNQLSGSAGGGVVAKDALGNDVIASDWINTHGPGDRTLTQGLKGDPTYLVVEKDKTLATYGINAVCTHLGCVVPWNAAENKFICPCHGSQYNNQGKVVRGPAPLSLALVHADVDDGKVVFVPWVETDFRTGENPWWA
ncbi:cytochrome b6-f complex iron-sulfur subunit 1, chloroplastic [Dorcoceras hygrometricum]|uniref:plastoquinol--plastocyanin reductase n=1 Tax=Dorcoceras hygrometricum TaxID=472368 RepID=A0A2Z7DKJ9_9LAMI|nr:cytochrome b6-f complex iron-sulfur subunit 1, chloroplastic [Dorcoceras hygrometricum]